MINTVIFDMDGTVLDTLTDLANAINHELSRYSMPERTIDEIRHFVGNGIRVALKLAAPEGTADEVLDDMVAELRRVDALAHKILPIDIDEVGNMPSSRVLGNRLAS